MSFYNKGVQKFTDLHMFTLKSQALRLTEGGTYPELPTQPKFFVQAVQTNTVV